MATGKLISSLKVAVFSILLFLSSQAAADYMVDYGPGPVVCTSCDQPCNRCPREYHHRAHHAHPYYRHHYAHHIRRHGSYRFEIIYTTIPYPDYYYQNCNNCSRLSCGDSPCQYRAPRCRVSRGNYADYPVRTINTCGECQSCNRGMSYDRATADDVSTYY